MGRHRRRRNRRERMLLRRRIILSVVLIVMVGLAFFVLWKLINNDSDKDVTMEFTQPTTEAETTTSAFDIEAEKKIHISEVLAEARRLAAGYDYDAATVLLENDPYYTENLEMLEMVEQFQIDRTALKPYTKIEEITHISFESIIMNTALAFDGDQRANEYNNKNVTYTEFIAILNALYENDYVLVDIHDLMQFDTTTDSEGNTVITKSRGTLYLPEGKKPLVLSQDDVSYYTSMYGNGFAQRLVIDENGKIATEMYVNGQLSVGSYDLIPILEDFIEAHPDFSYRGARGIIALTGYEGIFGYRTDPANRGTVRYDEDLETVKEIVAILKEKGWVFASHSYAHKHVVTMTLEEFKADCDRWNSEVNSLLGGDVDIYIWPYGEDSGDGVGTWRGYSGEKYEYLKQLGFRYYCNVDATNAYWVQSTDSYLRMGRIDITGSRMNDDLNNGKDRLGFLFPVADVFEYNARPSFK